MLFMSLFGTQETTSNYQKRLSEVVVQGSWHNGTETHVTRGPHV